MKMYCIKYEKDIHTMISLDHCVFPRQLDLIILCFMSGSVEVAVIICGECRKGRNSVWSTLSLWDVFMWFSVPPVNSGATAAVLI